jgi:hypothetical protein
MRDARSELRSDEAAGGIPLTAPLLFATGGLGWLRNVRSGTLFKGAYRLEYGTARTRMRAQ